MSWTEIIVLQLQLAICLIVYLVINRKEMHLVVNRFYLSLTPLLLLLFTVLSPYYQTEVQSIVSIELPEVIINLQPTAAASFSIVTLIYGIGVVLSLLIFLFQLIRVMRQPVIKQLTKNNQISVYLIENKADSYSFMNNIYISESQLHQVEYILKHERAHCLQKHSWDILLLQLFQIVFWFNPIFIIWKRKMKENHEYLADKASIDNHDEIESYSYALLSAQLGINIPQMGNGFNEPSLLHKRIIQLKSQNKIKMKHLILIPAFVGTALLTASFTTPTNTVSETPKSIVTEIDQQPQFPGGMDGMIEYFQSNLKYPEALKESKATGKVYVNFIVKADGSLTEVTILRSSNEALFDSEAIRLVSGMPNWKPAIKDGKKVAAEMQLPISFQI